MIDLRKEQEESAKANQVCKTIIDKVREIIPELAQTNGANLDPFLEDFYSQVPVQDHEKARPILSKVVILGLLYRVAEAELYSQLDQVSRFLPEECIPQELIN
jgi:hypothetical protein